MTNLSKILRCTKLFGANCDFVHQAKTKDEIMHVFSGHLAEKHKEAINKMSKEELEHEIEKNIESLD